MSQRTLILSVLTAAFAGGLVAAIALTGRGVQAQAAPATQQSAVTLVDRCCFDLDGGGKADDGIFSVNLKGDVLMALIYEDPDGNKKFEGKDEIKAASLGNLTKEMVGR
ncbi:MAG: hypothetical protein ACREMX_00965 [Gemmatimonadales bacterium]